MKKVFLVAGLMTAVAFVACDKDDEENMNTTDETFITQVGLGNRAEIEAGNLAATKGTNAGVKMYGQMMVTEHSTAQTELKSIGSSVNRNVPDTLDPEHKALAARLMTLSGKAFDTAYMNSQVRDHQKTLTIFQAEVSSGENQRVRDYANKYLPHIQMHLRQADSLAKAVK